ncbi:MAG: hypothetical protein AAB510_02255 [Patescibacteria group bacterium]
MIPSILIIFFVSLVSIMGMLGRKLILLRNGRIQIEEIVNFELDYFKDIRGVLLRKLRRYEHISLIILLKIYVKSINFLKIKYTETKSKIIKNHILGEKKEISKFLRAIGDYKKRINTIKHRITEEENSL